MSASGRAGKRSSALSWLRPAAGFINYAPGAVCVSMSVAAVARVCKQLFSASAPSYFKVGRKGEWLAETPGMFPSTCTGGCFFLAAADGLPVDSSSLFLKRSLLFARKGKSGDDSHEMSLDLHITEKRRERNCTVLAMIIQKGKWFITANNGGEKV